MTVSTCRKKLSIKVTVSIIGKNPSPIATMKASFKTKFPLDRKKAFSGRSLFKNIFKKWFLLARKSVSLLGMKHSLKNVFAIRKNWFFLLENQGKWFSLA